MQAAQRAGGGRQRIVDVDEARLQPFRAELAFAKHAREEAARVAAFLEFDQPRAGERGRVELHLTPRTLPGSSATRRRAAPPGDAAPASSAACRVKRETRHRR